MKTIESVLVATDLTEASGEVLRAAAAIARSTGARLHVLHSFDFPIVPYTEENRRAATFKSRIGDARRELSEQVRLATGPDVEVASEEVVIYIAHKAIREHADGVDADLIVMGPHRVRPTADAILGSTADRVIRSSPVPCLIVRAPLALPLRRVLVPLDLSKTAQGALDRALEWSATLGPNDGGPSGAELTVLHVVPPEFASENFPFDREVIAPELHRAVQAAIDRVGDVSHVTVREDVRWGDSPVQEIVGMAKEEETDLLVLGTHGQGAIKRALIGSVASGVARSASCSVLLVPPALSMIEPD